MASKRVSDTSVRMEIPKIKFKTIKVRVWFKSVPLEGTAFIIALAISITVDLGDTLTLVQLSEKANTSAVPDL